MSPKDVNLKSIFQKYRRVIAVVLLFSLLTFSLGILPNQKFAIAQEAETDDEKHDRGESTPDANAFTDIVWGPVETFGQMLSNFNYSDVLNAVLRNALTKIIDRFYNKVLQKFEEAYRVRETYDDLWLPYINTAFSKFHQWISVNTGGGMQAPFLQAFLGLENYFYKWTIDVGHAAEASILQKFVKGMQAGGAETPETAKEKLGTNQYWNALVDSIGNDGATLTIMAAAKLQEQKDDAKAAANMDNLNAEGLNKGTSVMDPPAGGWLDPLYTYRIKAGTNLNRDEAINKLKAWKYTEVANNGDLTTAAGGKQGTYRFSDYDANSKILHIWSWSDDAPVGIIHSGSAPYYIGMIAYYDPTSGQNKNTTSEYFFTSRPEYDPTHSGWTGLVQRPGQKVAQYMKDMINMRLDNANDPTNALKGLGKVMYEMMDMFTNAVDFEVQYAPAGHPMEGCPIGFQGKIDDLWKEMMPFNGTEKPGELDCLLKAVKEYGFELLPRFLSYVGCMAKKLICWVFNVNADIGQKDATDKDKRKNLPQAYSQYDTEPVNLGTDSAPEYESGPWGENVVTQLDPTTGKPIPTQNAWNSTESFLQHVSQYFLYTKIIKPHIPAFLRPSSWIGSILNWLAKTFLPDELLDLYEWIADNLDDIFDFVGDIIDSELYGDLISWLIQVLGFCDECKDDEPIPIPGGGGSTAGTCQEICRLPENQDSIYYTGKYRVYYYGPNEPDIWLMDEGGEIKYQDFYADNGGLLPGFYNHIKFDACNCTVDGQGQSTYDNPVGWKLRLTQNAGLGVDQQAFESSLPETQKVQIFNNSICNNFNYGCNMPEHNMRGQWNKEDHAWIPFGQAGVIGPAGSSVEANEAGIGVLVGRNAVPRNVHFTLETKKVQTPGPAVTDYKQTKQFVIPIVMNSVFDIVMPMNDYKSGSQTFNDADLPEPILRQVTPSKPIKVVDYLESGNTYELELYLLNKASEINWAMSTSTLSGRLGVAPIGPDTVSGKNCISFPEPDPSSAGWRAARVDWNKPGIVYATNRATEFKKGLKRQGYSYTEYQQVEAQAANNFSEGQQKKWEPVHAVPIYDENANATDQVLQAMGLGPGDAHLFTEEPHETVEPYEYFAGNWVDNILNSAFGDANDIYIVKDINGNPWTPSGLFKKIWNGIKFIGAHKMGWIGPAVRWFTGKGRNNGAPTTPTLEEWQWRASVVGAQDIKDQASQGSSGSSPGNDVGIQQVLAFNDPANALIKKNKSPMKFEVKPGCDGKIVPFALYMYKDSDSNPIATIPFFWQIGLPETAAPPTSGIDLVPEADVPDEEFENGDEFEVGVDIRNIGTQSMPTGQMFNVKIEYKYENDDDWSNLVNPTHNGSAVDLRLANIDAGNHRAFEFDWRMEKDEQVCFRVTADASNEVAESPNPPAEGNNQDRACTEEVENLLPDLQSTTVSDLPGGDRGFDGPESAEPGEEIDISFSIKNNGPGDLTEDFKARIYYCYGNSGSCAYESDYSALSGKESISDDLDSGHFTELDKEWTIKSEDELGPNDDYVYFGIDIDVDDDVEERDENNNKGGLTGEYNKLFWRVEIEGAPAQNDVDLEVTDASIDLLTMENKQLEASFSFQNNSDNYPIRANALEHRVTLNRLGSNPGSRNSQTNCYANISEMYGHSGGSSLDLQPGEERTLSIDPEYIGIVSGERYQLKVVFNDVDLFGWPNPDIDASNNTLCSDPVTPETTSFLPENAGQPLSQQVASLEQKSTPKAASGATLGHLSFKQRAQRVWAYALAWFKK